MSKFMVQRIWPLEVIHELVRHDDSKSWSESGFDDVMSSDNSGTLRRYVARSFALLVEGSHVVGVFWKFGFSNSRKY
jgi:hypothetical protein